VLCSVWCSVCFNMFCCLFAVNVCCNALRYMYRTCSFWNKLKRAANYNTLSTHTTPRMLHHTQKHTTHHTLQHTATQSPNARKREQTFCNLQHTLSTHCNPRGNTHGDTCCKHRVEKLARAGASTVGCAQT